ncbi:LysR substrate-binding domain-containing protein [Hydrogenovibrio thermophilus]|uniref:LysR family transcriptional regulator n=1 Tax=Hydrogenovibrio thermophilus TaxID=265883 RepID=A0A410H609_9GAMM|nr:LysR substrate-binding domain-containing protein [Hydrogenovibrio thermophilus]QAB16349.1 LysR family transcriptional regulator [Hydrogenovibrio thermophilus]
MIDVRHLKTLLALQQHNSVSLAAQTLCMTQSALSHQIKQLEHSLGLKLFERKSSPIRFTPAGKMLLKTAQEIVPKLEQTEMALKSFEAGEQGRLFIGVECHTCFEWLLPVMRSYQQAWQGVDMDVVNSLSGAANNQALSNLQRQKLDLVITSDPIELSGVIYKELFSYESVLVTAAGHPLAESDWITPQDLKHETLIHYPVPKEKLDVFKHFLMPADISPNERLSEMTLMMLQLVESRKGVCVLPKWLLATLPEFQHLPTLRLGTQGLWSKLYAAIHEDAENKAYIGAFIDRIKQEMQNT